MADEALFSRETFLRIAEASGLDVNDEHHMDQLYAFLQTLLPALKTIGKIDLSGVEPLLAWVPTRDEVRPRNS